MKLLTEAFGEKSGILNLGVSLLAFGTVFQGILDLLWRDFDRGHQPIQSLADHIPARAFFACLLGVCLLLAGTGFFWRRTLRESIFTTAILYSVVGLFSLPRLYTLSHRYGFHLTIVLGVLGEMLMQFIIVAGCIVFASGFEPQVWPWLMKLRWVPRLIFGLSGLLFGMGHLINTRGIVHMIPSWMPFTASFWILLSGISFALAGLAILSGVLAALAAQLLALMFLMFEVILVPMLFEYAHVHQAWGANAYNLTVAGSVFIYAASLGIQQRELTSTAVPHHAAASSRLDSRSVQDSRS